MSINADAIENGKGGKIILWADGTTQTAATLAARGGLVGGDGGFIETSGKQSVDIAGSVLAGASHGHNGLWLTDPTSVTVDAAYAATIATALNSGTDHQITTGAFGADNPATITVNSAILKTAGGEATLSITAADGVILNKRIASTSGMLNINVYGDSDRDGLGGLTINNTGAASGYAFETNGGDFKFWGQSLVFNHYNGINTSSSVIGGDITLTHNDFDWAEFYADAASPALPANHYGLDTGGTGNVTITSRYRGTNDFVELYDNAIRGYNVTITATTLSLGRHIGNGIPEIVYYGSYPVTSPGTDARLEMRNENSSSSLAAVGASLQEVNAKNQVLSQIDKISAVLQSLKQSIDLLFGGNNPSVLPNIPQASPVVKPVVQRSALQVNPPPSDALFLGGPLVRPIIVSNENNGSEVKMKAEDLGKLADGKVNTAKWIYDETKPVGERLVPGSKTTIYNPIDTMTITVNGEKKEINAYANFKDDGSKDANGPFQCTALVAEYLDALGFKNAPGSLPDGRDVAESLGTGANKEYFSFSPDKRFPPQAGSIISMETGTGGVADTKAAGHVAIVKGVEKVGDKEIILTLIEQNATFGTPEFAKNRKVTLTKGDNDAWNGKYITVGQHTYSIINWVTPSSLPGP